MTNPTPTTAQEKRQQLLIQYLAEVLKTGELLDTPAIAGADPKKVYLVQFILQMTRDFEEAIKEINL